MLDLIGKIMNMTEEEIKNHPHLLVNAFDLQQRVLLWNKQCEIYFGIKEEEALGKKLEELLPEAIKHSNISHFYRALEGEAVYLVNSKYERKPGTYDQVLMPLKNENGKVIGALSIVIELPRERQEPERIFSLPKDIYLKYSSD